MAILRHPVCVTMALVLLAPQVAAQEALTLRVAADHGAHKGVS